MTGRLLAAALLSAALIAPPAVTPALAAPDSNPSPPPSSDGNSSGSKKKDRRSEQRFQDGYRAAYASIYDRADYARAIDQLKALGHDDNASVATLIGYSYRKLGDYKLAQAWYERALTADPNHTKTWQYYGLWQVEQGNRERAQVHLARIAQLCGNTSCEEYTSLAAAIGGAGASY
ncbi:tetratricopeptide repeat protein [Rhodopseudomonas palustris]|uniref:Tetratricopeptide repeat protein n=1 Tax=Rhodopseudomonas palustris TaxID=1076 RepID=A0A418V1Q5_RHOPL|nr:tetratricopeptide repeat protein [Rhodopseudomonas palustris]RJF69825.1 tetratricopeptide repeat protein [Rhodopseudomonas palustris]